MTGLLPPTRRDRGDLDRSRSPWTSPTAPSPRRSEPSAAAGSAPTRTRGRRTRAAASRASWVWRSTATRPSPAPATTSGAPRPTAGPRSAGRASTGAVSVVRRAGGVAGTGEGVRRRRSRVPHRHLDGWTDRRRARHRRADARWLRPLLTGEEIWCQLFSEPGAGSDLAGAAHDRGARRRRVDRERPEGLVVGCALLPPGDAARPHGSRRPQARGDHLLPPRHEHAGHRGATAPADDRRRALQRGVLHRRPHARRRSPRRRQRWMARRADHAAERASRDRAS